MENSELINCAIIGSGPAGYTAAIYAARAGLNPHIFTGISPGGQLTLTTDVENYPGYPDGVLGPEMMEDFRKQAERFGTTMHYKHVTKVNFSEGKHEIELDAKDKVYAKTIVIATGASARWLGLESETKYNGFGVSACAVCDGFFFKEQNVAIVGAGDTAAEEATYLSKICNKVTMIIRKDYMRASKAMQKRVFNTENIDILWNTETVEILGDGQNVNGAELHNNKMKENFRIDVDGFFIAIGHTPNTELFKNSLDMDSEGYLITKSDCTHTNVNGVFACGDVQDKTYRQAVTAAGSGCMAALDAERYLAAFEA